MGDVGRLPGQPAGPAPDQLPREYGGTSDVELPRDREGCARMVEEAKYQLRSL